uniref:Uncharacterized protein n=1 Tax=Compsopogon caeruleus TaxID=31354 RepID=A0A7S1TIQ1_9RHOD|mmetsp:Transcript_8079/g.16267  ORF Transcript_8079/g.16267 Transcript_8079/m.16267 type:complete len:172 (+) Transcript_8079:442-957(+)
MLSMSSDNDESSVKISKCQTIHQKFSMELTTICENSVSNTEMVIVCMSRAFNPLEIDHCTTLISIDRRLHVATMRELNRLRRSWHYYGRIGPRCWPYGLYWSFQQELGLRLRLSEHLGISPTRRNREVRFQTQRRVSSSIFFMPELKLMISSKDSLFASPCTSGRRLPSRV